ncbi:glycosyltransferase family 4 protein [Pontibacillus salicampi]|uniref:Glycosyltransferase family 4 protein n=1 Tax=Pontibacillus salicampi TaxID=1449801 RepID=A0ABV6LSZ1_9BACI
MKVLMLTDKLTMGGAENYFIKLENKMIQGTDFNLFTAAGDGELTDLIKNKSHHMTLARENHLLNLWRLTKYINKKHITVIHANSLRMFFYACFLRMTTGKLRLKILYTKHNITSLEKFPKIFSFCMNYGVNGIITVSDFEKEVLIRYGVKREKITTVYNGVDLERFPFKEKTPKEKFNVGILARLSPEKNHNLFLDIASSLKQKGDIKFYIAGDGPEREEIQKKIEKMGLKEKVEMLGAVEPKKFLESMDILLLTSKREVFPMVILEAMASGTPVVSIDRGGIREAIQDQETGMMVDKHCSKAFNEKIVSLKSDCELRNRIIDAARKKVIREFTSNNMVTKTFEQY